jgi:hypothetical protein
MSSIATTHDEFRNLSIVLPTAISLSVDTKAQSARRTSRFKMFEANEPQQKCADYREAHEKFNNRKAL